MRFCPLCHGFLLPNDIRPFRFDCPHCLKTLTPCYFRGYMWIRALVCAGAALTQAWRHGWHDSFIIFVFGLYMLPMLFLWDLTVQSFFLPKEFKPAGPTFQTLGLNSR